MKKRLISIVCLVAVMVSSFCVGLYAAGGKEEVKAWLRHDLNVEYNGVKQKMRDATGATVLPLTYNDSTYLPVRAISNLLGVHVDWDGDTNTVLLGAKYDVTNFINAIEPYSASKSWAVTKEGDRKDKNIGGIKSKSYITIGSRAEAYYNLEAYKNETDYYFTELNFKVYNSGNEEELIDVYIDGVLRSTIYIEPKNIPEEREINLKGVKQIQFVRQGDGGTPIYIIDAQLN